MTKGVLSLGQGAVFASELQSVEETIDQLLAEGAAGQRALNASSEAAHG